MANTSIHDHIKEVDKVLEQHKDNEDNVMEKLLYAMTSKCYKEASLEAISDVYAE